MRDVSRASNSLRVLIPEEIIALRQLPFMLMAALRRAFILKMWSCSRLSIERRKESSMFRVCAERVDFRADVGRAVQFMVTWVSLLRVERMAVCC